MAVSTNFFSVSVSSSYEQTIIFVVIFLFSIMQIKRFYLPYKYSDIFENRNFYHSFFIQSR